MNYAREIETNGQTVSHVRYMYMDGWRGVAIAGVLIDHFGFSRVVNLGRYGVEMFFVLSGILMADILFVRQTPLRTYFPRRFSRTFPGLFIFVIAISAFGAVTGHFQISEGAFISALTTVYNYYSIYVHRVGTFDNIWSLCIEEHAYMCLALVALAQRRLGVSPILSISALTIFCLSNGLFRTYVFNEDYYSVYWRSDVRGASILIGCIAKLLLSRFSINITGPRLTIFILSSSLALNFNFIPDPIKYSIGTATIAIGLMLIPYPNNNIIVRTLSSKYIVWVGLVSYSLYLWQQPFAQSSSRILKLLSLPLVIICCLLSFFLIEKPARAVLNKWWTGSAPKAPMISNGA